MIVLRIFVFIWVIFCSVRIAQNYQKYGFLDWFIALFIAVLPFLIVHFVAKRKGKRNNRTAPPSIPTPDFFVGNPNAPDWTPQMQQDYENAVRQEQQSGNPKFHRTEKEEELSFQFSMNYSDKIFDLEEKFQALYSQASSAKTEQEELELLKKTVDAFEKAKRFCYGKGKGGMIYFQDMWEHLHNSRRECFSYIDDIIDRIEDLGDSLDIYEEPQILPGFDINSIDKRILKKYRRYDVPNRLRIINESFKIIQTTKDVDTFFSRYNTAMEHCRLLELPQFANTINSVFGSSLKACYMRQILAVKTEKGKQNRHEKFIVSLAKYFNPDQVQQFIDDTKHN